MKLKHRKELFKTEMQNLEIYGYGAKGFILAMVETAIRTTNGENYQQMKSTRLSTLAKPY